MTKKATTALVMCAALTASADGLQGFAYGTYSAPSGNEWQSPEELSLNKEQSRAHIFHFASEQEAGRVLPDGSRYYQSLNGTWKFRWEASPERRDSSFWQTDYDDIDWDDIAVPGCWNVQGLQSDGGMRYGVPIYVNQPVIFYHEVREDDWRKGVMREPPTQWTTYEYRNEVGQYRRTFTVPKDWAGRQVFIHFDGVDSFFYLWVNGHYVGFSKNSRNTASFNITPYLDRKAREQQVAVEVYRNSDGSFLESQDMFRLPGIIRSTYLTSSPATEICDLAVRTTSIDGNSATVGIDIGIRNHGGKKARGCGVGYKVLPVELYGDETGEAVVSLQGADTHSELTIPNAKLWSAEEPNRYVLVATLTDSKGREIDRVSTYFGVRTVEIRQTEADEDEFGLAGRYLYINGKPVKLKGVNRHETNPSTGHAITRGQMEREVMLMKRANINHVRLSHYSNDPYWYYLADKYGLYLEDEANVESHEYYYGKASLSHPKEWEAAHVARNMEMARAHVNHPSIVIWSLGNEAGPGHNFVAAAQAIREFDTSRPIQYERDTDNGWRNVDIGSNQYPSVAWVRNVAKGNARVKYPFHISEFAHSMGNSLGNFADYWEAMESTNFFCGGAVWDWVDQAIDTYTPDGTCYWGYGGDHGDWPNDGMFCMNGIMLPDLTPKPQYYEVKKVLQNVGVSLVDRAQGTIEVLNKNYFLPLDYDVVYEVRQDGRLLYEGTLDELKGLAPRSRMQVRMPLTFMEAKDWDNITVNIQFRLPKDMPWAERGYVQMEEQLEYQRGAQDTPFPSIAVVAQTGDTLSLSQTDGETCVQGKGFEVCFDNGDGYIKSLIYNGKTVFEPGNGPKIDAFRAPTDNDNWAWSQWFINGLHNLRHHATCQPTVARGEDGSVRILYNIVSQAPCAGIAKHRPGKAGQPFESIEDGRELGEEDFHFTTTVRYTVFPDGSIGVACGIVSSDESLALPRLGFATKLPVQYNRYAYYGRGPLNNYADRKTGSFVGLYESTVAEQFVPFPKPQSMGNREDVHWCSLTTEEGDGVQFIADYDELMSTSALPWSDMQMTLVAHPHELPESDGTYLHLDCKVNGLGGNSCGQGGPLEQDRVKGALHQFKLLIRPLAQGDDAVERSHVQYLDLCPVTIVRDRAGYLTFNNDDETRDGYGLMYTITPLGGKAGKPALYDGTPIPLQGGGIVEAWYESESDIRATATFERIERIPIEVVFASSEEGPGGEVAANLVDGNPETIWHTMYSITMGTYPHWVEFDCNEVKTIKGFTYLPRQDSPNGDIKGYRLELSMDGKEWGEPVAEGEFPRSKEEQRVLLAKPQKARYVRFTALSSQNGDAFASGAEFGVLAE